MVQGIVKEVFRKCVNSILSTNSSDTFRQSTDSISQFHERMKKKFPRMAMGLEDVKNFISLYSGIIERNMMIMFNSQSKDLK